MMKINEVKFRKFLKLTTVIASVVTTGALIAGCSAETDPETSQGIYGRVSTFWVDTIDGRQIPCVSWTAGYAGGMSCNWERQ